MDYVKNLSGTGGSASAADQPQQQTSGGLMGKVNTAFGGGQAGEKNEDILDKGIDFVQERTGGGQQSDESAIEQAKDEQFSDAIRRGWKSNTGSEFPVADK